MRLLRCRFGYLIATLFCRFRCSADHLLLLFGQALQRAARDEDRVLGHGKAERREDLGVIPGLRIHTRGGRGDLRLHHASGEGLRQFRRLHQGRLRADQLREAVGHGAESAEALAAQLFKRGHGFLGIKPRGRPGHHVKQAKPLAGQTRFNEGALQIGKAFGLCVIHDKLRQCIGIE